MNIVQAIFEALESLSANKLRSSLTILGIVIGVAAVIAMVSIGRGAQAEITDSIQGIGTNLIFVFRGGGGCAQPQTMTLATPKPSLTPSRPISDGRAHLAGQRQDHGWWREHHDHHPRRNP
jgi:putative ABC transport system permease protein